MDNNRQHLISRAVWVEGLTIAWLGIEAIASIWAGRSTGSITLTALGVESAVGVGSAFVLLRSLNTALRRGQGLAKATEHSPARVASTILHALTVYIVVAALWSLFRRQGQAYTPTGLVVASLAIPILYWLSRRKSVLAQALGSRALRADSDQTGTGGWLAGTAAVGLIVDYLGGGWWIDAVTSLTIAGFVAQEARDAWE